LATELSDHLGYEEKSGTPPGAGGAHKPTTDYTSKNRAGSERSGRSIWGGARGTRESSLRSSAGPQGIAMTRRRHRRDDLSACMPAEWTVRDIGFHLEGRAGWQLLRPRHHLQKISPTASSRRFKGPADPPGLDRSIRFLLTSMRWWFVIKGSATGRPACGPKQGRPPTSSSGVDTRPAIQATCWESGSNPARGAKIWLRCWTEGCATPRDVRDVLIAWARRIEGPGTRGKKSKPFLAKKTPWWQTCVVQPG